MFFIRLALPPAILHDTRMEDGIISFGSRYLALRKNSGVTQWSVAQHLGYHVANLNKVERGLVEPRIVRAVQLVKLVVPDGVGDFFREWAVACNLVDVPPTGALVLDLGQEPLEVPKGACPFGLLFLRARLLGGVSQKRVCETAGYSIRNMSLVETGRREPNTTIAMKMVAATRLDVGEFFTILSSLC